MSVLIKGMDMPKNCAVCFMRYVSCTNRIYMKNNRPDWCPLVKVPTPHGALIDRNAIVADQIEKLPPVIEAEE